MFGLNWLTKTLELLLILFPANYYYFHLIHGFFLLNIIFWFNLINLIPIPTPAPNRGGPVAYIGGQ